MISAPTSNSGILIRCVAFVAALLPVGAVCQGMDLSESIKVPAENVATVLLSDKDLCNNHRGYLAFLDHHPDIASAEEAFSDLTTISAFRAAVWTFDEALWREPTRQDQFDQYYACLAKNERLRQAVDTLYRIEFEHGALCREYGEAMLHLRAHPDQALAFLQYPSRLVPVPDTLDGLDRFLRQNKELRESLLQTFREIDNETAAHADVFPWWKSLADPAGSLFVPYKDLCAHFSLYPHHFWVWHRYNTLTAQDPHWRDWMRYWHRRTRHAKGLGWSYAEYLKLVRDKPEYRRTAEEDWTKRFGPVPEWPPQGSPPWFDAPAADNDRGHRKKLGSTSLKTKAKPPSELVKPRVPRPIPPTPPKKPSPSKKPEESPGNASAE